MGPQDAETTKRLREKYKDVDAEQVNAFVQRLPRDLLFVLRGNSIIRGVNALLGGTSEQRFETTLCTIIEGTHLPFSPADELNTDDFNAPVSYETRPLGFPNRWQRIRLHWQLLTLRGWVALARISLNCYGQLMGVLVGFAACGRKCNN